MVPDCWEIEGQIVGILPRYSDFSHRSPTLGWPVNLYPASSLSSGSAASPSDWSLPFLLTLPYPPPISPLGVSSITLRWPVYSSSRTPGT